MLTLASTGKSVTFGPDATSFSLNNCQFLAQVSNLAYCDGSLACPQLAEAGFNCTGVVDVGVVHFVFASCPDAIVVGFRGTRPNQLADWELDSRATMLAWDAGATHQGFNHALEQVWSDELLPRLKDAQRANGGARIWFTGHSLGGALAELATARSFNLFGSARVGGLYTFGKPRVGNQAYSDSFSARFAGSAYRCVYRNDLVPTVPSHAVGYRHIGEGEADLFHFDESGTLSIGQGAWRNYTDRMSTVAHHILAFVEGTMSELHPDSAPDHELANYLNAIYLALSR